MAFLRYLVYALTKPQSLQRHNITTFLATICQTDAKHSGYALTDWPYAQVSYIPFIHLNPEHLHLLRGPSPQISWMWHAHGLGVEGLHAVDAMMKMLQLMSNSLGPHV